MCKVMEDMRKESEQQAEQKTLLQAIKNVMESFGVSVEKAMDSLKVPNDQRAHYESLINPKPTR